jgi:hypothetical protein
VMGSIDYIAPEQIEGHVIDGRADVYSLGCVLYRSLTGEVPFSRPNELAVLWAHVREEPPKPSTVRPGLPKAMDDVTTRAMAKSPADRYAAAGGLASAAAQAIGDRTVVLPRLPQRIGGPGRRLWWIAAALAVVTGVAVGVVLASRGASPPPPADYPTSLWRINPATNEAQQFAGTPVTHPVDFAAGEGALWIATPSGVTRVDEDDGNAQALDVEGSPRAIAVGGGDVWVLTDVAGEPLGSALVRIDAATNIVQPAVPLPVHADTLAVQPGAVWLLSYFQGRLTRFDPDTKGFLRIPAGPGPKALAIGPKAVWVVSDESRRPSATPALTRLDFPVTRSSPRPAVSFTFPIEAVAAGEGGVWVIDSAAGAVRRIDPESFEVGPPVSVEPGPFAITTGNGSIWVASRHAISRLLRSERTPITIQVGGVRVLSVASEHTPGAGEDRREIWVLVDNAA